MVGDENDGCDCVQGKHAVKSNLHEQQRFPGDCAAFQHKYSAAAAAVEQI